jgi:acyl-ACP thioesterase
MEIKVNLADAPAMREWLTARGLAFSENRAWFSRTFSVSGSAQEIAELNASLGEFHKERLREGAW